MLLGCRIVSLSFLACNMTLSDYANKKFSKGKEWDSFYQRWNGYDLDTDPVNFFNHLILNQDPSYISHGISLLAELEICEAELEEVVLEYCRQILSDSDFFDRNSGKYNIFESLIWILGEVGKVDSQKFISKLISDEFDKFKDSGNFDHILTACQYSFYRINQREIADFFVKIKTIKEVPVKTQSEIDAMRKLNPKYAEFQQFLLENYKKYGGGILN